MSKVREWDSKGIYQIQGTAEANQMKRDSPRIIICTFLPEEEIIVHLSYKDQSHDE